ncbi:hypothetical protein ZHAS_00006912 [Anopheles sinensis]|uniref:Uncharacterized protein n=1 Tax=Anopheles sinensis TaxID=74873 RepID=A0A084VNM1_ANOSI|nr:hypothetical protein ZHAS_00006912 [Anopheles sinensis]
MLYDTVANATTKPRETFLLAASTIALAIDCDRRAHFGPGRAGRSNEESGVAGAGTEELPRNKDWVTKKGDQ